MKYEEIIKHISELYDSVSEFAHEEGFSIPEDFVFSNAVEIQKQKYDAAYKAWQATPGYNDYKLRDSEYERLYSEWRAIQNPDDLMRNEYLESIGLGPWEEIEHYGGEDCGSTWYSIKHFTKHNVYVKVDGWYQSYHGTDFDGWDTACSEVRPVQKMVTVFDTI